MKEYTQYIGIVAGILTSASLLPQLIKIIREKKVQGVSLGMFIVLLLGVGCWMWYGIEKTDYPIILTNGFSLLINSFILFFSIKYKNAK
ncbi:SemiSWEET transporter [Niastella populi]|uniref:MtN3 and saliva related transmembrane protein n=1 Tax=Niastella populi TaxID=550983 RepID=A0A1V9FV69_9BACT|nr:SemiSWEET transporter [Niastella populi]OQP62245.1 hypothetical protein A4R26_18400 [Niastella populi]